MVEIALNSEEVIPRLICGILLRLLIFHEIFRFHYCSNMVEMFRYAGPVNPAVFPHLAITLLTIGTFFATWFFVYEVTSNKYTRQLKKELSISVISAGFLGFGTLFLCNWAGVFI